MSCSEVLITSDGDFEVVLTLTMILAISLSS